VPPILVYGGREGLRIRRFHPQQRAGRRRCDRLMPSLRKSRRLHPAVSTDGLLDGAGSPVGMVMHGSPRAGAVVRFEHPTAAAAVSSGGVFRLGSRRRGRALYGQARATT